MAQLMAVLLERDRELDEKRAAASTLQNRPVVAVETLKGAGPRRFVVQTRKRQIADVDGVCCPSGLPILSSLQLRDGQAVMASASKGDHKPDSWSKGALAGGRLLASGDGKVDD